MLILIIGDGTVTSQTTGDQVHLQAERIQSFQSLQNEFAKFNETFMKLQANPSIESLHQQVNNLLQDVQTEQNYSRSLQVNYRNLQESNEKFNQTHSSQAQQIHQLEQQQVKTLINNNHKLLPLRPNERKLRPPCKQFVQTYGKKLGSTKRPSPNKEES